MTTHLGNRFRVVRATRKHLEMLTELFYAYLSFYRCDQDRERVKTFLAARLLRKESALFVALEGTGAMTRAVGFAQLYPTFSSLRLSRMWVLNDLYTVPDRRRLGVAHLLLAAAHTMAVGTSASHLELITERSNGGAQRVYESVGFRRDDRSCRYEQDLVDAEHPAMLA
ncbi:MAG: GNAT family N-acetyltransferase [Gemmatimonadaceae bacterium]